MKTTFDIPDSIYREFKVKTAQNDRCYQNRVYSILVITKIEAFLFWWLQRVAGFGTIGP